MVIKNVNYFYGACADSITDADKGPEGLDCPPNTEYQILYTNKQKVVDARPIYLTKENQYEKICNMTKTDKVVACFEEFSDAEKFYNVLFSR